MAAGSGQSNGASRRPDRRPRRRRVGPRRAAIGGSAAAEMTGAIGRANRVSFVSFARLPQHARSPGTHRFGFVTDDEGATGRELLGLAGLPLGLDTSADADAGAALELGALPPSAAVGGAAALRGGRTLALVLASRRARERCIERARAWRARAAVG